MINRLFKKTITTIALLGLVACGGGGGGGGGESGGGESSVPTYTVAGTVSGLTGTLELSIHCHDYQCTDENMTISADGSFDFKVAVRHRTQITVDVLSQPTGQVCRFNNSIYRGYSGSIQSADANLSISCIAGYSVSGTVSGLNTSGDVYITNDGDGETLRMTGNSNFTFREVFDDGANYSASIKTHPTGQSCSISNSSGVISGAEVSLSVVCSPLTDGAYTIGGSVSGLNGTVSLYNNGTSGKNYLTVTADGSFTFAEASNDGEWYYVGIATLHQPVGQSCSVSSGSGLISSANVTSVSVLCTDLTYTVGGSVSGLTGTLVLQNNDGDNLTLSADGGFSFASPIKYASTYSVSVLSQPAGQSCSVSSGSDTISSANVTTVAVACIDIPTYTVGGSVSGLTGTMVLQNNSGDDLTVTANGSFTFATAIYDATSYGVSILSPPEGQNCSISSGNGVVTSADISSVAVSCKDPLTISMIAMDYTNHISTRPDRFYGSVLSGTPNILNVTKTVADGTSSTYDIVSSTSLIDQCPLSSSYNSASLVAADENEAHQHYALSCSNSAGEKGFYIIDSSGNLLWQSAPITGLGDVFLNNETIYYFIKNKSFSAKYTQAESLGTFYNYSTESQYASGRLPPVSSMPAMYHLPQVNFFPDGKIIVNIQEYNSDGGQIQVCNGIVPCYYVSSGMITDSEGFYHVLNVDGTLDVKLSHKHIADWVGDQTGSTYNTGDSGFVSDNGVMNIYLNSTSSGNQGQQLQVSSSYLATLAELIIPPPPIDPGGGGALASCTPSYDNSLNTGDPQIDTFCQTAWVYSCAGSIDAVQGTCQILSGFGSNYSSQCSYCSGN